MNDKYNERLQLAAIFVDEHENMVTFRAKIYEMLSFVTECIEQGEDGKKIIRENKNTFKILCYEPLVMLAAVHAKDNIKIVKEHEPLREVFRSMLNLERVISIIRQEVGYNGEEIKIATMVEGIRRFNKIPKLIPSDKENGLSGTYLEPDSFDEPIDMSEEDEEDSNEIEEFDDDGELPIELGNYEEEDRNEAEEGLIEDNTEYEDKKEAEPEIEPAADNKVQYDEEVENRVDISDIEDIVINDITEVVRSIINRNEAVFRSCLELDKAYGMIYDKGLLTYKIKDGSLLYNHGEGTTTSLFEELYKKLSRQYRQGIRCAQDLRNIPNTNNILNNSYNYYPGYIFKYALGIVDKERHNNWKDFKKSLEKSLDRRFKEMYQQKVFTNNRELIEQSFGAAIVVIYYEPGSGMKIRLSLPGSHIDISRLENDIRSIITYRNASITIVRVSGYSDVVDVQILQDEDKFLSRPNWAYQAMRAKISNGDKISLTEGLPIGRKLNGEIVNFQLDKSNRFLTFIAAGSGAGKGVLTLSIVGAAIGTGIPVMYIDYKPDMAPIFWDFEKKYGINTFTFDAMEKSRRNRENDERYKIGYGMPDEVKPHLERFGGAILYLRAVQMMCAMALYRSNNPSKEIMFIFDETQAIQRVIKALVDKIVEIRKTNKPKKGENGNVIYRYASSLLDWIKEVNVNIDTYVNTTGRKSNTFCIFIAQNPDWSTWKEMEAKADDNTGLKLLGRITFSDTIFKILGRGSTTSKYGLGGDGKKSITTKELQYVTNNRFFGMYDGKTTDGANIQVFKPFLTLNTDDPYDGCWMNGIGKSFGAGIVPNETYISNILEEHEGERGYVNQYGIHIGTGVIGLASMYCGGDIEKVKQGMGAGHEYALEFMGEVGLSQDYNTPEDYMYDMSEEGMLFVADMVNYQGRKNRIEGDSWEDEEYGESEDTVFDIPQTRKESLSESSSTLNSSYGKTNNSLYGGGKVIGNRESMSDLFIESVEIADKSEVDEKEVDQLYKNLMDSAPDDADLLSYISQSLVDDVQRGECHPELAKALSKKYELLEKGYINSYNYGDGNVKVIKEEKRHNPIIVESNDNNVLLYFDKILGIIKTNNDKIQNAVALNNTNSIDCSSRKYRNKPSLFEKIMYSTPHGTIKKSESIWKDVLNRITYNGLREELVTKISLYGGKLYVNGKYVILDGIVGGEYNIELRAIVGFKVMLKKFSNIREIRLDEEMIRVALTEFRSKPIDNLFLIAGRLDTVYLLRVDGSIEEYNRNEENVNIDKVTREAVFKNEFDLLCDSKRHSNNMQGIGDRIWGVKLAKNSLSNAGKAFMDKNKPSIPKMVVYGTIGVVGGAIGVGAWGVVNLFKNVSKIGKAFK